MAEHVATPATPAGQRSLARAQGILVARNGWSLDEALTALAAAARGNELTIEEMAECLIADQDLNQLLSFGGGSRPVDVDREWTGAGPGDHLL